MLILTSPIHPIPWRVPLLLRHGPCDPEPALWAAVCALAPRRPLLSVCWWAALRWWRR